MARILKFTLHDHGVASVHMPKQAHPIHVAEQAGALQVWADCLAEGPMVERKFAVLFTGFDEIPRFASHIGTVLSSGGNIVRHVYEIEDDDF